MTAHELAKKLLEEPNVPVVVYSQDPDADHLLEFAALTAQLIKSDSDFVKGLNPDQAKKGDFVIVIS